MERPVSMCDSACQEEAPPRGAAVYVQPLWRGLGGLEHVSGAESGEQ